jgi:hypothetical protein
LRNKRGRESIDEDVNEKDKRNGKEEDDKDFAYYGEEDLYYKEEKITQQELNEIKDEVRANRLKLIPYLNEEETVQKALNRLNPKKAKQKQVNKKQKVEDSDKKIEPDANKFNELLDIVSKLTELSYFDVYTDTIEKIEQAYGKQDVKWKYRIVNKKTGETKDFGDFTTEQIKEWYNKVSIIIYIEIFTRQRG